MKKISCIFALLFCAEILVSCTQFESLKPALKEIVMPHKNEWVTTDFSKSDVSTADGDVGYY